MATRFMLSRMLPGSSEIRTQGPVASVRAAAVMASYVLYDNTGTSKADAQLFAGELSKLPVGSMVRHEPTGYAFCIERLNEAELAIRG